MRCEAEVRGKALAKWPSFGVSVSFAFLLFLLFSSAARSPSPFFVYGNRCANYAMRNVIGKWQLVE